MPKDIHCLSRGHAANVLLGCMALPLLDPGRIFGSMRNEGYHRLTTDDKPERMSPLVLSTPLAVILLHSLYHTTAIKVMFFADGLERSGGPKGEEKRPRDELTVEKEEAC